MPNEPELNPDLAETEEDVEAHVNKDGFVTWAAVTRPATTEKNDAGNTSSVKKHE